LRKSASGTGLDFVVAVTAIVDPPRDCRQLIRNPKRPSKKQSMYRFIHWQTSGKLEKFVLPAHWTVCTLRKSSHHVWNGNTLASSLRGRTRDYAGISASHTA